MLLKSKLYGFLILACLLISACQSMKGPSMSGDPAKMSGDTLCYKHATTADEELRAALGTEIDLRGLDCMEALRRDPLNDWRGSGIGDAHRHMQIR